MCMSNQSTIMMSVSQRCSVFHTPTDAPLVVNSDFVSLKYSLF